MTKSVNSIFISDSHLGWSHSRGDRLATFLRGYQAKYVYLIGDIIELWHFPRKFHLTKGTLDAFSELLRMRDNGTHIVYIPGNHDACFRDSRYASLPGIEIVKQKIHITAKYERVLIFHGDEFDTVLQMKISPLLYKIGDSFYYFAIWINKWINIFRKMFGLKYWSFSHYLKTKVKDAIKYLADFETMVVEHAKANNADVVVCGHIHLAADKEIDGIRYLNTGSWIDGEGSSAVIEHEDGRLELYREEEK